MEFSELRTVLEKLLGNDDRPVAAYSSIVPLARAFPGPAGELPARILETLLAAVGPRRTLLMPTYTPGFREGFINLDEEPGRTGMVNELFRKMPGTRRTASVFWSFAARGPQSAELAGLRPRQAWGEGSVFDWIDKHDAHLLVLGVPWHMCSFLHRVEWLAKVPYRYEKIFEGEMILDGARQPLKEKVFVRSLDPLADNEWPGLDALLSVAGMRCAAVGLSQAAEVGAKALLQALVPLAEKDPFAFVKKPEAWRRSAGHANPQGGR